MPPWEKYQYRYNARPETFDAYVDTWTRLPETRMAFGGWVGFAQAASAEPSLVAKRPERVRLAEKLMHQAGYQIGSPTEKGARQWVRIERRPRFMLRFFGIKLSA
jgi:hypothetical protein